MPRLFAGGGKPASRHRPTNYWRIRVVSPNEPLKPSNDQPSTCRSVLPMLRAVVVSTIASLSILVSLPCVVPCLVLFLGQAVAGPLLGDDVATCRERQTDFKARLDACERIIAAGQVKGKDLAVALAVRGEGFSQKRDYDGAIASFNSAAEADPDNVRIIDARAVAHQRKGEDDLAMADYNLALRKRPNYGGAYNDRGTLYMRKMALQSALDDFNLAVQFTPTLYVARTNRARILTMNKDFDGALADFAEAQKIDPDAVNTSVYRCRTYTAMGKLDDALADCNNAIGRQPKNQVALNNRADAYVAKGNFDAALKDFNAILALNPNNVRAHTGRGQLFEKRRDLEQARADYRSAAFALLPFDEMDTSIARAAARERLDALTAQGQGVANTGR